MKSRLDVFFLLLCACGLVAGAQNETTPDATSNIAVEATVGWKAGPTGRGTLMLIYSCLSTMFASTWTVLHLNVSDPKEAWWEKAGRKAKWMGITVLFPEFIFSKAVCELRLAIADLYDMHVALKKANLEWTDSKIEGNEKIIMTWTWYADFGRRMRFMYRLLGLGEPTLAESKQPVAVQQMGGNRGSSPTPPVMVEEDESNTGPNKTRASVEPTPASDDGGIDQEGNDDAPRSAEASGYQPHVGQSEKPSSNNAPGGQATELDTISQWEDGENYPPAADIELAALGEDQPGEGRRRSASASTTSQESPMQYRLRSRSPPKEVKWPTMRRNWTLVHSFYVNMGGLLCATNRGGTYPIMANTLVNAIKFSGDTNNRLKLLDLSKAEIEDKSKADWLLKVITMAQITWLIMNVWARAITHVPITQLEIATVAFSLMAIATYASCWWKPKDVAQPTFLARLPAIFQADNKRCFKSFVNRLLVPSKSKDVPLDFERRRIHNDTIWMEGEPPMPQVMLMLIALSSIVFGGLHCLAWNFEFPSDAELILWRVASVSSATLPVISLGITFFINVLATSFADNRHMGSVIHLFAPLSQVPDQYWVLLRQEPSFSKWPWKSWFVFRTMLEHKAPGDAPSDWEKKPAPHLPPDAPPEARTVGVHESWALSENLRKLQSFIEYWTTIKHSTDKWGLTSNTEFLLSIGRVQFAKSEPDIIALSRHFREYEAFLRAQLDCSVPGSAPPCVWDFIISLRPAVQELENKRDAFKDSCDRASRIVTIYSGILYATSRMAILVLIFTSLRAVPEGVYEYTPWTRFLPNIS